MKTVCALLVACLAVCSGPALAQQAGRGEPTLADLRRAALRFAGLDHHPERTWVRRSRLAGLLPDLSLSLDRDLARDEDLSRSSSGTQRLDRGTDEDLSLQARAVWRFDRLLFDDVELRILQIAQQRQRERTELLMQVTRIYYQRQRLQLALGRAGNKTPPAEQALAIEELGEQLDALTGGYFRHAQTQPSRAHRPGAIPQAPGAARPTPDEPAHTGPE
ncbi:hypothetical protein Hoch_3899 [Haliangium ochraceum DSM 14365]|uniref:Outer membrane efflux protein n=1 Tax=Haliangium ochraceum (strain DSM 14365 / JCM 11303 / SMP-2) TaxID=502025 RepID=D0LZD6_HALO1|nr:hypothetical protein Hoch_3899 [Haliangium ochraceum DSM 14365]